MLACCIFCPVHSVDIHNTSMLGILCLSLEGAAGLGLVLCYHSLCWNYSVHFCFTDLSELRTLQYHKQVTERRILESICIAGMKITTGVLFSNVTVTGVLPASKVAGSVPNHPSIELQWWHKVVEEGKLFMWKSQQLLKHRRVFLFGGFSFG